MEPGKDTPKIHLTEDYLKESIDRSSVTLVGKIMKRFEIIENRQLLKSEVKELIYEEYRSLREMLLAYSLGIELSSFKFISKGGKNNVRN